MVDRDIRESVRWLDYRKELNAFILLPETRMVMNADLEWNSRSKVNSGGRAAFKLQNGQVVREFVTIWELFDHREAFVKCIRKLTEKAIEIRQRVRFSKIVTATPSARELGEHLVDALRKKMPEQDFALNHFGNYPKAALAHNTSQEFRDEHVLILSDVVNSGYLVATMGEIIEKRGGKTAAVLSALITNPEWIAFQHEHRQPVSLRVGRSEVLLHNLADFVVRPLEPSEYDESKIIPIDYSSVLPERRNVSSTHYPPAFDVRTMFEHIEEAEAVDFGFFELSDARLTCAFILPRLLERYQKVIWSHIREPIVEAAKRSTEQFSGNSSQAGGLLLVTTPNRKDLLFKDFIQDRLNEDGYKTETALTLKRGLKDTPYLNLTLGAGGMDVKGKEVILALGTLSTQEQLRNIVSLLVDGQVKSVIVICLLNRLGPFTINFIRAIERFTKRVTVEMPGSAKTSFTNFSFSMVYNLLDLRDADLSSIGNELESLSAEFRKQTKVPSFVRLCDRIEGYFDSRPYIERAYVKSSYQVLETRYGLPDKNGSPPVEVTTHEGKIALITYNLSLNRDFKPILEELVSTLDRRTFIHLYGLILSDIHYLRFSGTLRTLKDDIVERLDSLRQERFSLERGKENLGSALGLERVRELINAEVYLIYGLGIIAHYESRENLKGLERGAVSLLFCGKTPAEWLSSYPGSLHEYFSDERVFFVIAFLLHGLFPNFHRSSVATSVKEALDSEVEHFKKAFKQTLPASSSEVKSRARLIMNNFDLMLTETGKHDHQEKHQIIRDLHRMVLRPKEGHNPIFTTLRELISAMRDLIEASAKRADTFATDAELPLSRGEEEVLLTKVDNALSGTSYLHLIARSVQQLFFFTPTIQAQQERYTNPVDQPGFASDVDALIRKLNDLRQRRSFYRGDFDRISELDTKLRSDFLDADSHLRDVLKSYVVNLDEIVETFLNEINATLNKVGFSDILLPAYQDIHNKRAQGRCNWPVLGEQHLLRELFRNLFSNLTHSFRMPQRADLPADTVRIEFEEKRYAPHPENGEKSGAALKMWVRGIPPKMETLLNPEQTIGDQLLRIQELGGSWELNEDENREGYTFVLRLLTRFGYRSFEGADVDSVQIATERELDDEL